MRSLIAMLLVITVSIGLPVMAAGDTAAQQQREQVREKLAAVGDIVDEEIQAGKIPGAVVLIGTPGGVLYRGAFGHSSLEPSQSPMTEDTVFDLASLTKVVATTTAIMQLAEKGKVRIDAPVARYWPAFGAKGKKRITIRQLLTHYSGLRADLDMKSAWSGYKNAMRMIVREKPACPAGTCFIYSDINFEVLGEIVRRVSGQPLNVYCSRNIFKPLRMVDTGFKPAGALRDRIAPTEYSGGEMLRGQVHDPACRRMGGMAGHAGLFSTADDLSRFALMLLNGGSARGVRILKASTVEEMTTPQSPAGGRALRGFGWDIEPVLSSNRDELPRVGSFAHLGYTGTSLWIDPVSRVYVIVLTNRVHPDGNGDVKALRANIKALVADVIGPVSPDRIMSMRPSLSRYFRPVENPRATSQLQKNVTFSRVVSPLRGNMVLTGIDVLDADKFLPLLGKRVGLITNHTGLDAEGRRTLDLLNRAPGVKLAAVFSPEHGLFGKADKEVSSMREPATGLPVYSLYGEARRPTDRMLKGLDALVFDIQDAGVRFYTYISTMGYAMEAAARKGIDFYVLDRPNPITASLVQGPVMDSDLKCFTGYFPMPVRHGMTVGELAEMFNREYKIGARLHVIKMQGYQRGDWYDETGLRWVNPSPNLRSLTEAVLYPGTAMVEGANVSVGRGTETPFELLGAPWIDAGKLTEYLRGRRIAGVQFTPVTFMPGSDIYKNKTCRGVKISITDRERLDSAAMGVEIVSALYRLYPRDFQIDSTLGLIGARDVLQAIKEGRDPQDVALLWQGPLEKFIKLRANYLLY